MVAGIVTDLHRIQITKRDWLDIIAVFAERLKKPVDEFHTKHFYRGNGIWRDLDGQQRTDVMNALLEWLTKRNHKVVFSTIDKAKADKADYRDETRLPDERGKACYWRYGRCTCCLASQKLSRAMLERTDRS